MMVIRIMYHWVPVNLSLQDYPHYYACITSLENIAFAWIGGMLGFQFVVRRDVREQPDTAQESRQE